MTNKRPPAVDEDESSCGAEEQEGFILFKTLPIKETSLVDKTTTDNGSIREGSLPTMATTSSVPSRVNEVVSFGQLGLSQWLVEHVEGTLLMLKPTPVQSICIPPALSGKNILGISKTGSGKTAAFLLPLLDHLGRDLFGVFAVILTPTRELAQQIAEQVALLGAPLPSLKCHLVVGGVDQQEQASQLTSQRPHIIVATPGRLADLLDAHVVDLTRCRMCVLDEADRLLGGTFATHELPCIFNSLQESSFNGLKRVRRTPLQWMAFTATRTPTCYDFISQKGNFFTYDSYSSHSNVVQGSSDVLVELPGNVTLQYALIPSRIRLAAFAWCVQNVWLAQDSPWRSVMVFVGRCRTAELLRLTLSNLSKGKTPQKDDKKSKISDAGIYTLHSGLSQRQRQASLNAFRNGTCNTLITTDVGSRGLDIPTVDLVINYDLPEDPVDFVHRIGRAGRSNPHHNPHSSTNGSIKDKGALALSLVTELDIARVHRIEAYVGKQLGEYTVAKDTLPLFKLSKNDRKAKHKLHPELTRDQLDLFPLSMDDLEREILKDLLKVEEARLEAEMWLDGHHEHLKKQLANKTKHRANHDEQ